MTSNEYLRKTIQNKKHSNTYSTNDTVIFDNLKNIFSNNFNSIINTSSYTHINLFIQQSGSRAKGTAVKGKSDIDMFLSIHDPYNFLTLEDYYNKIYNFMNNRYKHVRKQNVSIGLEYQGHDVDIVPAKRVNSQNWDRKNDHYLWSTKKRNRMLTNIQKHIDIVKSSNAQDEIILAKLWKKKHNIDISSIYLEMLVIDSLKNNKTYSLDRDFLTTLKYISDNIVNKKVVDPANSNNIISDTLMHREKVVISDMAKNALSAEYWSDII